MWCAVAFVRWIGRTCMRWTCSFNLILFVFMWWRPKCLLLSHRFAMAMLGDVLGDVVVVAAAVWWCWAMIPLFCTVYVRVHSLFSCISMDEGRRRHEKFHMIFTCDDVFCVKHTAISNRLWGKMQMQCEWHCGNGDEHFLHWAKSFQFRCPIIKIKNQ